MKKGKTLQELAVEIDRQQKTKRDFLVFAPKIRTYVNAGIMELGFQTSNEEELFGGPLTETGHDQIGQYCKIPAKYYDAMRAHPGLLAQNVAHWLNISSDRRMIRTLDGEIRGFLSDSYRRLDNYDLAQAVLPILKEAGAQIESCDITARRFYIKAVTEKVQDEIRTSKNVGEVVWAGVEIVNSEIGYGTLAINPMAYELSCKNGNIAPKYGMRKYHVGRKEEEMAQIEFSNETKKADDKAFWLKCRDLIKHSLSETTFKMITADMQRAAGIKILLPEKAIELASTTYEFNQGEKDGILGHLINGGDMTNFGFGRAVTRMAQDVESYDRSTELEVIGFEMMSGHWN